MCAQVLEPAPAEAGGEMVMKSFDDIMRAVRDRPNKTVAMAKPEEAIVLRAAVDARDLGLADSILVGDQPEIERIAKQHGYDIHGIEIVHEPDKEAASRRAVSLVSGGQADFLLKGLVDTSILLRAVLDREIGLRTGRLLSHICLMEFPHVPRLIAATDAGMNISPSPDERIEIIENAVELMHRLGVREPKVALLAAIEKVNPAMPITLEERQIMDTVEFTGAKVCGPISYDVAMFPECAELKKFHHPVAGNADILVTPDIHSGNLLVKCAMTMPGVKWAGFVMGARAPCIVTSRGDIDPDIRILSIATCSLMSS
jgi:phosphate butyryltransferase